MNLQEFLSLYSSVGQKKKVKITCICGKEKELTKERILDNIKKHIDYTCRSCVMKKHYVNSPMQQETKDKISKSTKGKIVSKETREKMTLSAYEKWASPKGQQQKENLSALAAKQHSKQKMEKTRIRGLYFSKKNNDFVVYASSYELLRCYILDLDDTVESYQTQVYYKINNNNRSLDFLIKYKDGKITAEEIKPIQMIKKQKEQIIDSSKNAKINGWKFKLITESFFKMKSKKITEWAIKFRKENNNIDNTEYMKEKRRRVIKKYYENVIKKNKVKFFCDYCKEEHERFKHEYLKNIKKNNRFICHKENSFKSKNKKENPYKDQNLKKCLSCEKILDLNFFWKQSSKSDGRYNVCINCMKVKRAKQ